VLNFVIEQSHLIFFQRTEVLPQYMQAPAGLILKSPQGFHVVSRVALAPGEMENRDTILSAPTI
jgi:hypothetical protein